MVVEADCGCVGGFSRGKLDWVQRLDVAENAQTQHFLV